MNSTQSQATNSSIPAGAAQAILMLLRKIETEKRQMASLGVNHPELTLWLTPEGDLVYRRYRRSAKCRRQPLLVHRFDVVNPINIALISRVVVWVANGNYAALADNMSEQDLADAFRKQFFQKIGDESGDLKAKAALIN